MRLGYTQAEAIGEAERLAGDGHSSLGDRIRPVLRSIAPANTTLTTEN